MPHATINDIAHICNVSAATVSRALNNKPGVGESLRKEIIECARMHEYVPNSTARFLRSKRHNRAYVILRSGSDGEIPFPFPPNETIKGITGIDTYVHIVPFGEDLIADLQRIREDDQPRMFVIVGPCGVADGSLFRTLLTPLLFVICDDAPPGYPAVSSDDVQGSAAITDSLLAAGHKRIEVLTDDGKTKPNYSMRVMGYRESLERHGLSFDPSLVHAIPVDFSHYFPSSEEQLKKRILPILHSQSFLLHDPPTAVFVLSDFLAFTLMRVLWNAGIVVPRQLSVASFGGWPVTQYTPVSVQTWVQPLNDIIATTLKAMSCLLSNELFPRTLLLPTRRPDGHHAFARASAPTRYIVPGYMRSGESVSSPTGSAPI
jgi:DNA-binding LacI/PurR family transcriptional regulator